MTGKMLLNLTAIMILYMDNLSSCNFTCENKLDNGTHVII